MNKITCLVVCLVVLPLMGCATSWVGKNVNELIAERGEPTYTTDDGKGGQVLFYSSFESRNNPGGYSSTPGLTYYKDGKYIHTPGRSTYKQPSRTTVWKEWHFYVDSSGIIYDAEYDRDARTVNTDTIYPKIR